MTSSRMRKDSAEPSSLDLLLGNRSTKPHAAAKQTPRETSENVLVPDCVDDEDGCDDADKAKHILEMMLRDDRSQDVLFLPANVAGPHTIPFFPAWQQPKPCLKSWSSPAAYHRLFHSARIRGYLHHETHLSPTVIQHSEWWVLPPTWPQRTAIEAIGLLQLDSERHDERLQIQGRQRHAAVLQWSQSSLHDGRFDAEVIFLTMMMMIVCEVSGALQDG